MMASVLIEAMAGAIEEVRRMPEKVVQVFHHNDSDGLTSGAILTRAFEREGFEVRRFCLEKPYPAVLEKVYEQSGKLIVFADFAGRIAPLLSELNQGRNLTLILDHHVAEPSTDPRVINLDPISSVSRATATSQARRPAICSRGRSTPPTATSRTWRPWARSATASSSTARW